MVKHTNHNTAQPVIHARSKAKKRKATKKGKGLTWGGAIDWGYLRTPTFLLRHLGDLGISGNANTLAILILSHAHDDDDLPYPSMAYLGQCTGWSVSKVQRVLRELVDAGYLVITSGQGVGVSNIYDFEPLFDALQSLRQSENSDD